MLIDVSFKVSYPYILCEHHLKNVATLMLKLCKWGGPSWDWGF
jgi:hypothetical protein